MIRKLWSRRSLIIFGFKFFGSSYLLASGLTRSQKESEPHNTPLRDNHLYDCIVIGAGMSGLTVADQLRHKSVLVLEASNRIGGRVFTDRSTFKRQIERGAEYIHIDPLDTPLWRKVFQYNLKIFKISKLNGYIYHSLLKANGILSSIATIFKLGLINVLKLFNIIDSNGINNTSAEDFLKSLVNQSIDQKPSVFLDFQRMILSGHLGAPEKRLSLKGFKLDYISEQLKVPSEYYIRSGYGSLIDHMAEGINIKMQEPVASVSKYESPHGSFIYQISTKTGKTFLTRSVCYSASIGVLKSNYIKFNPPLPTKKILAIGQLEMSHHVKIQLEFTRVFWPNDMSMLNRIDQMRRMGKTYFVAYTDVPSAPPMLTALIMGNDAIKLYPMSEDEMINSICLDLQDCFPEVGDIFQLLNKDSYGRPAVSITQWNKNEFVKGGVSYLKINTENNFPTDLVRSTYASSQETPGIFWAGEAAAIYEQPASVHGAHSAGLRASIEIEHFLNGQTITDEKKIAKLYHQKFGMKNAMCWNSNISRTPDDGDDEQSWRYKLNSLFD